MAAPISLVSTKEMSREEWLSWRRKGIGSSDAAAILGLSAYNSPILVYYDKLGQRPEQEENEAMKAGNRLEPVVADWFAEETGWKVQHRWAILQNPTYPFMLANLDREFFHPEHGRCPLEIKTTGEWRKDEWEDGKAPFAAQIQLQHQLAVTGAKFGAIAALIGGNKFRWLPMMRDDDLINNYLIPAELEFWRRVQEQDPPPFIGIEAEAELLQEMIPKSVPDKETILPMEVAQLLQEYAEAHKAVKEAEARKDAAGLMIKAAFGDAEIGYLGGEVVATYKTINAERFDQTGFQAAHPALFQEWKKAAPYRRLDLKKKKGA